MKFRKDKIKRKVGVGEFSKNFVQTLKETRIAFAPFREVSLLVLDEYSIFLRIDRRVIVQMSREYLREYYGQWRIVEGSVGCAAITLCVVIKGHSQRSAV